MAGFSLTRVLGLYVRAGSEPLLPLHAMNCYMQGGGYILVLCLPTQRSQADQLLQHLPEHAQVQYSASVVRPWPQPSSTASSSSHPGLQT